MIDMGGSSARATARLSPPIGEGAGPARAGPAVVGESGQPASGPRLPRRRRRCNGRSCGIPYCGTPVAPSVAAIERRRNDVGHHPDGVIRETCEVTTRSAELMAVAQRIADALPVGVDEAIVTGSVSRGVADDVSDIELLVVTPTRIELEECYSHAAACGLTNLGTWGPQGGPTSRVSGYREGVPIELIWWSRAQADEALDAIFAGQPAGTADALAHGVALRTSGL